MHKHLRTALLASTALGFLLASPAQAADSTADAIKALQEQVNALQKQLVTMQAKEKARTDAEATKAAAVAATPAAVADAGKKEILPGVSVKLGGFIAMEGAYRDKNQSSDMASNINTGIPFENDTDAHSDEFRASARQTRMSILAEGKPDKDTKLAAFVEADFMGQGTNSSSVQTNNYNPRLRHAYATVDREDWGFHFLGGQAWSLATPYKSGLANMQAAGVPTIDSAGPPGYVYTRSPQLRFVKSLADNKVNLGLSLEEPEINYGGLTAPAGAGVAAGTSDFAPDVIAKVAYDSSFGHYELFGMTRFFRNVLSASGHNNYTMGVGGGASAYIPMFSKKLDFAVNFIGGKGIGRYISAQLPDVAYTQTGDIKPLTQMAAMVGFIGRPDPTWDLYLYAGAQKIMRQNDATGYGYGNFDNDNSGCYALGSGDCEAQTETLWQITPGFWKTVYKGDYGNMKVGGQYSLTRRDAFSGADNQSPHAFENIVMMSFRYSPF